MSSNLACNEATARGCLFVVEEACKVKKMALRVPPWLSRVSATRAPCAARWFAEKKAKVVGHQ